MSDTAESLSSDAGILAQLSSAIQSLQNGDSDTSKLVSTIVDQVGAALVQPVKATLVSHSVLELVKSQLPLDTLVELFTAVFQSLPEEQRPLREETLAVALLETIDAIQFVGEDIDGLEKPAEFPYGKDIADKGVQLVAKLVENQSIPKHLANLILSPDPLIALYLHPTPLKPAILQRGLIRLTTSTFLKQRTTNLLRESSEGFSRLIVLLTDPDSVGTGDEDEASRTRRAQQVWKHVRSLVGNFGLAPIRVYDLILEVASCHIATHWRFFLALLDNAGFRSQSSQQIQGDELYRIEHCLDVEPDDDQTLAKALSFRLKWYKTSDNGSIPPGMLFLTALLIKFGFIKAGHLIPSLSPDEDGMDEVSKRYQAAMTQRYRAANSLANTVLADDDAPAAADGTPVEAPEPPKPQVDQKSQLLFHLLAIGESSVSLYLLAKYPWTVQADPRIASVLLRNIEYSMEPVYRQIAESAVGAAPYAAAPPHVGREPQQQLSLLTPAPPASVRFRYEFFFPDWSQDLEVWETVEDVYMKGERWFGLVRALGGREVSVMAKLCRIITHHFDVLRKQKLSALGDSNQQVDITPTDAELAPWRGLIRNTLLPALSVSGSIQGAFDQELQELFKVFNWETVASFLGEWRDGTTNPKSRTNALPAVHATTNSTREIKQALSRVTAAQSATPLLPGQQAAPVPVTDNRGPSRALAKHGHANPLGLWTTGNGQVMSYGSVGNIGEYFMEVARYSNSLSKDIAMYTWVDTLATNRHNKSVENLATFVGLINRRFIFTLNPLLQLIASGLKGGEEFALVVVEKLMSGMTGEDIVDNGSTSNAQMEAFAAGPEMIREAFYSSEITSGEIKPLRSKELVMQVRKSVPRLSRALQDTQLAVPILVGLARMATQALSYDPTIPAKLMGNKKDNTREVFVQYSDFIAQQLPSQTRASDIPTLSQLYGQAGIEAQLCWVILRNKLGAVVSDKELANGMEVDGDSGGHWWPSALDATVEESLQFLETGVKDVMGAGFYVRFNTLSVSDIVEATATYETAQDRLSKDIRNLESSMPSLLSSQQTAARWDINNLKARKRQLLAESQKQKEHVERVRTQLQAESSKWFAQAVEQGRDGQLIQQLHDQCFYRRAIQSPADAYFVAKFIRMAHDFNVPGFSTALTFNLFFQAKVATKIYECTENEAQNLGRCLLLLLADLDTWFQDEDRYHREALGGPKPEPNADMPDYPLQGMFFRLTANEQKRPMSWDRFKDYYAKLHNNLTTSLILCLKDERYYSPKNAVLIALRLLPYWPIMENNSKAIETEVKKVLAKGDITRDIIPAFNSYLAQLANRKRQRPVVPAARFHPAAAKKAEADARAKAQAALAASKQAKADAEAKAAEKAATDEVAAVAEDGAKSASPAPAPSTDSPTVETSSTAKNPNAKILRQKLEQDRAAREAKRQAAVPAADADVEATRTASNAQQDRQSGSAMGPPAELSVDEARAAARARKFGAMTATDSPRGDSRHSTPRNSPPPGSRQQRSGTDDSRVSDRSRRREDERDRRGARDDRRSGRERGDRPDDRDRDRERRERRQDRRGEESSRDSRDSRVRDDRAREDRHRERDRDERDRRHGETGRSASRDEAGAGAGAAPERDSARPPQDDARDRRDGRDRRDDRDNRDRRRRGEARDGADESQTPKIPQPAAREQPPHQRESDRRGDRDRRPRRDDTPTTRGPGDGRDGGPPRGPRDQTDSARGDTSTAPSPREPPQGPSNANTGDNRFRPSDQRGSGPPLRDARDGPRDSRPGSGHGRDLPSNPTTSHSSLAARMGLAPAPAPSPPDGGRRDDRDRKRPLDTEGAPLSREGSPNSKRRRGGGREREERRSGGNRLFGGAMKAASSSQRRQLE